MGVETLRIVIILRQWHHIRKSRAEKPGGHTVQVQGKKADQLESPKCARNTNKRMVQWKEIPREQGLSAFRNNAKNKNWWLFLVTSDFRMTGFSRAVAVTYRTSGNIWRYFGLA